MSRDYHVYEIGRILASAFTQITIPKGVIAACIGFWAWLSPKEATLLIILALFVLTVLDFITGIRVSLRKGKFIQSRLWGRIGDKFVAYGSLAIMALTLPKYAPGQWWMVVIVEGILTLVALGEFISVLENLSKLDVPYVGNVAKVLKIRATQMAQDLMSGDSKPQEGE